MNLKMHGYYTKFIIVFIVFICYALFAMGLRAKITKYFILVVNIILFETKRTTFFWIKIKILSSLNFFLLWFTTVISWRIWFRINVFSLFFQMKYRILFLGKPEHLDIFPYFFYRRVIYVKIMLNIFVCLKRIGCQNSLFIFINIKLFWMTNFFLIHICRFIQCLIMRAPISLLYICKFLFFFMGFHLKCINSDCFKFFILIFWFWIFYGIDILCLRRN